ncbi:MAG: hypothetical protein MJ177_03455 [Clostridia bacterium]|nr:hypothetical protein [Clostridia bacterium]
MKKVIAILTALVLLVSAASVTAFAAGEPVYCFDYFTVWPDSSISFGNGKDVYFSGDGKTMYVNTSVRLRVTALQPNVHIVIKSNATIYMMDNVASIGDIHAVSSPFVKVENGKNVILLFDHTQTVRATNTSVIENNGTLRLQCNDLTLISEGGCAISGNGTFINEVGDLKVNAIGGAGIVQGGAVNFKNATVTAVGGDSYPAIAGNPVNIENCKVTATGGSNAAGIGGGSTIAFSQVNIIDSLITANGGTCGIGAGTKAAVAPNAVVINPLSSVKGIISAGSVVNGDGEDVFLRKTENTVGSAITVNGSAVRWRGHGAETCLYLYLPKEGSVIGYDNSVTIDNFYITALCDDFPFNDLIFDEQSGLLTVKTEKPFSIKNVNPSAATSRHILIHAKGSADITLTGTNVNATQNTPAIELASYENGDDVTITTVKGTKNYLNGGREAEGIKKPNGLTKDMLFNKYLVERFLSSNSQLTIQGEGFLSISGFDAPGIGSPTGTANIKLLSGAITVTGERSGSGIGGGETEGFPKSDVVVGEWASVLYKDGIAYIDYIENDGAPETSFVNEYGEKVFPAEFKNSKGGTILFNGRELPFNSHGEEKSVCFYRPGGDLFFYTNSTLYCVSYNYNQRIFVKEKLDPTYTGGFTVTGGTPGTEYAFYNRDLHIFPAAYTTIKIENTDKTKAIDGRIIIHKDCSVKLIFAGINLSQGLGYDDNMSPVTIEPYSNGDVTIELLEGSENTIIPSYVSAGIEKSSTADNGTLTITGKGSLRVKGTGMSAAIGSAEREPTANIIINGGTIVADNSTSDAAAIGGGFYESSAENIVINGGKITAKSKKGAAIGGGRLGKGTGIIINGGEIEASSGIDTAIGFGEGSWKESDYTDYPVISLNASVKTNSKKENYRNSAGENVYAAKIENESGGDILVDSVKLDCTKHFNEKAVYVYLTGENHTVKADGAEYIYAFNSETLRFKKHTFHEHIFSTDWMYNEAYHCHPCTYEGCDYEIGEYASFTGDELKNSGYSTHEFTDFICVCGFEDIANCLAYYKDLISCTEPFSTASIKIRDKALEDIETLTTVADIKACYDKCIKDMDAAEKELSSAIKNAADEISKALDGYKSLLETEHGYDISEIEKEAKSGTDSVTMKSDIEKVNEARDNVLLNMKAQAVKIARMNTSLEIELAAMNVEASSDKVLKTVSTAKKAINACDSLDEIFDITEWAIDTIEVLGTKPHEHTFSTEYSRNEAAHWYAATCEHTDLTKELAAHSFGKGVTVGNTTTYTCSVCGYEKAVVDTDKEAVSKVAASAKSVIDKLVIGADSNVTAYAATAKAEIEKLTDITAVTEKLAEAIIKINSMKTVEKPTDPTEPAEPENPDVCPKCKHSHSNDFFGKIACFFNRIINWFTSLFA